MSLLGRIVDGLKWLLLIAAVGGPVLAYMDWSNAEHIRDVKARGTETQALIQGATESKRRRGGTSYSVTLAWRDSKGQALKAEDVSISNAFARRIIVDNKIVRSMVRIKYLADAPETAPMLLEDVEEQEASASRGLYLGVGGGAVGIVGTSLMFWFGRRRRAPTATASA